MDQHDLVNVDVASVNIIIQAVGDALLKVIVPGVTTQAEILSAMFTLIQRMLKNAREAEDVADHIQNVSEIHRVLTGLLLEFGTLTDHSVH